MRTQIWKIIICHFWATCHGLVTLRCSTGMNSCNPHNRFRTRTLCSSPFYRRGIWGMRRLQIAQGHRLVNARAGLWGLAAWLLGDVQTSNLRSEQGKILENGGDHPTVMMLGCFVVKTNMEIDGTLYVCFGLKQL